MSFVDRLQLAIVLIPPGIDRLLAEAQCFIDWCKSIDKTSWDQRKFLDSYKCLFISIGHTSLHKIWGNKSISFHTVAMVLPIVETQDFVSLLSKKKFFIYWILMTASRHI